MKNKKSNLKKRRIVRAAGFLWKIPQAISTIADF